MYFRKGIFEQLENMLHKLQAAEKRSCNEISVKNQHDTTGQPMHFDKANVSLHRNIAIQGRSVCRILSSKLCILKRRVHLALPWLSHTMYVTCINELAGVAIGCVWSGLQNTLIQPLYPSIGSRPALVQMCTYVAAESPEIFDLIFSLHINSRYMRMNPPPIMQLPVV